MPKGQEPTDFDKRILSYQNRGELVPTRKLIKTREQIAGIKRSCEVNTGVLDLVEKEIHAGMSTADIENFMEDELLVMLTSTGADGEAPFVHVGVNGVTKLLPREQPIMLKRKFVEVLARAKKTDFIQDLDFRLGDEMNRLRQAHAFKYPFQVMQDPAGVKGVEWLKRIFAQRR